MEPCGPQGQRLTPRQRRWQRSAGLTQTLGWAPPCGAALRTSPGPGPARCGGILGRWGVCSQRVPPRSRRCRGSPGCSRCSTRPACCRLLPHTSDKLYPAVLGHRVQTAVQGDANPRRLAFPTRCFFPWVPPAVRCSQPSEPARPRPASSGSSAAVPGPAPAPVLWLPGQVAISLLTYIWAGACCRQWWSLWTHYS